MIGHFLNSVFVKCFFKGKGETEKMAPTLLHSESGKKLRAFHVSNTDETRFFFCINNYLGHGFSAN